MRRSCSVGSRNLPPMSGTRDRRTMSSTSSTGLTSSGSNCVIRCGSGSLPSSGRPVNVTLELGVAAAICTNLSVRDAKYTPYNISDASFFWA